MKLMQLGHGRSFWRSRGPDRMSEVGTSPVSVWGCPIVKPLDTDWEEKSPFFSKNRGKSPSSCMGNVDPGAACVFWV